MLTECQGDSTAADPATVSDINPAVKPCVPSFAAPLPEGSVPVAGWPVVRGCRWRNYARCDDRAQVLKLGLDVTEPPTGE